MSEEPSSDGPFPLEDLFGEYNEEEYDEEYDNVDPVYNEGHDKLHEIHGEFDHDFGRIYDDNEDYDHDQIIDDMDY